MIISEVKLNNSKYKPSLNGLPIKTQTVDVICDICGKQYKAGYNYLEIGREKHGQDLCRSCKMKNEYKNGERKSKGWQWWNNGKSLDEKLGKARADKYRHTMSVLAKGKNNPNYGGIYSKGFAEEHLKRWGTFEEMYGEEEALRIKKKLSKATSGKNNPMFGKPSPQGSGNGWSGWYKGWYFRSLRELSYMINVIEKNNLKWESAEKKKYRIPYINWEGTERNYFADFIIGNNLIEIKPKKLINTDTVNRKRKAAEKFCKNIGLQYLLLSEEDFDSLSQHEIKNLIDNGIIKFIDRYEKRYSEEYEIK